MTVIGIRLTDTGDLPKVSAFVDGLESIANKAAVRLQTHAGEWILDKNVGLPFIDWTQQKNPDTGAMAAIVIAELLGIEGVTRVSEVEHSIDAESRRVTIAGKVFTRYGELKVTFAPTPSQKNSSPGVIISSGSGQIIASI